MWIFLSSVKIFILYADSEKNYKNFQTLIRIITRLFFNVFALF